MTLVLPGKQRLTAFIIWTSIVFALAGASLAGLEIVCLDVGQGDCTLVISPTGKTLLFDAGETGKGTGVVRPYLLSRGITGLDYVASSHYHVDHIGGMDEVVNAMGLDSLRVAALDRGWSYTTQAYTQYVNAVGAKRTTIIDGQVIDLGGGVTVTCVGVNGNGQLSPPFDTKYDENDLCVAILVEYCDFEFFAAGDLSGVNSSSYHDIETSVAADVGDIEIYKVDHHGSASNSNANLVSTMAPEVSIISVGSNSYGHPTQTVINRLVSYNSYIYQTELGSGGTIPSGKGEVVGGNVVILVDGGQYTVAGDVYTLSGAGVDVVQVPAFLSVYPNPFSDQATMHFGMAGPGNVAIKIFDVEGRLVNSYPATGGNAGSFTWNGFSSDNREAPAGVYFVRISGPSDSISRKIVKR
jgi:beta-lactamase superfamily II metal-dependent hydrolase